jgi:hypothetical protein
VNRPRAATLQPLLSPPFVVFVCQKRIIVSTMADRYIPEHRRTQFKAKNTFKPDELRRRREEQQVEIRKAKREENLAKRRGIGSGDSRPGAALGAAPDSDDESAPTESQVCRAQLSSLFSILSQSQPSSLARMPFYLAALCRDAGAFFCL